MQTTAMILNDLINSETTFQSPLGPAGVGVQSALPACAECSDLIPLKNKNTLYLLLLFAKILFFLPSVKVYWS